MDRNLFCFCLILDWIVIVIVDAALRVPRQQEFFFSFFFLVVRHPIYLGIIGSNMESLVLFSERPDGLFFLIIILALCKSPTPCGFHFFFFGDDY